MENIFNLLNIVGIICLTVVISVMFIRNYIDNKKIYKNSVKTETNIENSKFKP